MPIQVAEFPMRQSEVEIVVERGHEMALGEHLEDLLLREPLVPGQGPLTPVDYYTLFKIFKAWDLGQVVVVLGWGPCLVTAGSSAPFRPADPLANLIYAPQPSSALFQSDKRDDVAQAVKHWLGLECLICLEKVVQIG